jgi:hypothetical protein
LPKGYTPPLGGFSFGLVASGGGDEYSPGSTFTQICQAIFKNFFIFLIFPKTTKGALRASCLEKFKWNG